MSKKERLRQEIKSGTYLTEDKITVATERLWRETLDIPLDISGECGILPSVEVSRVEATNLDCGQTRC